MRLILLGAPGVGKGTQADLIMKKFHIPQISTGNMLRTAVASGSALGQQAEQIMKSGELVPDQIMVQLVKERIAQADCKDGFLLDGFPRTIPQAEALKTAGIDIDYVVEIDVEDSEIIKRITGRRVHAGSGRIYHADFHPPKVADIDDLTGEALIQRDDDKEETIRKRLEVYHRQTKPLVDYYINWMASKDPHAPKYLKISGVGSVADVNQHLLTVLQKNS